MLPGILRDDAMVHPHEVGQRDVEAALPGRCSRCSAQPVHFGCEFVSPRVPHVHDLPVGIVVQDGHHVVVGDFRRVCPSAA